MSDKVQDETRQGEAFAPFMATRISIKSDFILKAMAAR